MEPTEVKAAIEEQGRLVLAFREKVEKELEDIKKLGVPLAETTAAITKMNARFDEIEVKMARKPSLTPGVNRETEEAKSVETKAMEKYLRFGLRGNAALDRMDDAEKKAFSEMRHKSLSSQTDTGGGILIPEDFQSTVIQKIANIAGVGQLVSSITTSKDVVRWPKVNYTTDDVSSSPLAMTWEDTADSATSTDPTPLGSISIQAKKARGLVLIDRELVEDSMIDVTALLASLMADTIAVDTDKQLTIGAGTKTPAGFMIDPNISNTNSGSSGVFAHDTIIDLTYALPGQYAENASFMTRRASMGLIRKLKDSQNRYLWEPSTQVGTPATLYGYPIRGNEQMPAAAAGAKAMIFADFKRLYMAVNKIGLSVQRLDEKYADTDQVGFIYRLRKGGAVVSPWAGRFYTLS